MSIELNHTIVYAEDKRASAEFLAGLLGLGTSTFGPFVQVTTGNGVGLDYATAPKGDIAPQHYAFLVSDEEFDAAFDRIKAQGLTYWADPHHRREGEINRNDGGRGVYFLDPSGHNLELITVPYGGWPTR
ncbi:VOC family protein [Glycomyces luteolus]|uniref:VOC family protein n=1 Tax=Glycomyces luteolus TaxID=2670330 RepID=A0A9X3SV78_9ACTN|nr:VOC family protein [Glycomyces luteolus]MDA1362158.1 VOC family protein [Glycomyces luteolus]